MSVLLRYRVPGSSAASFPPVSWSGLQRTSTFIRYVLHLQQKYTAYCSIPRFQICSCLEDTLSFFLFISSFWIWNCPRSGPWNLRDRPRIWQFLSRITIQGRQVTHSDTIPRSSKRRQKEKLVSRLRILPLSRPAFFSSRMCIWFPSNKEPWSALHGVWPGSLPSSTYISTVPESAKHWEVLYHVLVLACVVVFLVRLDVLYVLFFVFLPITYISPHRWGW